MQFMITNKMKDILVNDLMYTEDEVDRMEPAVARIVIEKRLKRPVNGMPRTWDVSFSRDTGIGTRVSDVIKRIGERSVSALTSDTAMYLGCAATATYALKGMMNSLARRVDRRRGGPETSRAVRPNNFRENRFDLRYLEHLQRRSLFDMIRIAISVVKHRFL